MRSGDWTWLELSKLLVGTLTSIAIFYLTFSTSQAIRREQIASIHRTAVREFSDDVFERRVRAELLASSMKRYSSEPASELIEEIVERKRNYDTSYAEWNRAGQSNLMIIKEILGSDTYGDWDEIIDHRLVGRGFSPLDQCLTSAYDEVIRGRDPGRVLSSCECVDGVGDNSQCTSTQLISYIFDCGIGITDSLFALVGSGSIDALGLPEKVSRACVSP